MFNLGFSELLILAVIVLIFIGPQELPEIARVVGRMLNELKRASSDIKESILEPRRQIEQHMTEEKLDPHHQGDILPDPVKPPEDSSDPKKS